MYNFIARDRMTWACPYRPRILIGCFEVGAAYSLCHSVYLMFTSTPLSLLSFIMETIQNLDPTLISFWEGFPCPPPWNEELLFRWVKTCTFKLVNRLVCHRIVFAEQWFIHKCFKFNAHGRTWDTVSSYRREFLCGRTLQPWWGYVTHRLSGNYGSLLGIWRNVDHIAHRVTIGLRKYGC